VTATRLTDEDRDRYDRNLRIAGFGEAGQVRLAAARVLVVGLGGIGCPAALYLAAAGVGTLGLADPDRVEPSNLQRQVLHREAGLGLRKTRSAAESLRGLRAALRIEEHPVEVTAANAEAILGAYDAVVEATDRFEAKYLLNDACLALGKPFATAGILALSGHALFVVPGRTPCLRCAVPEVPRGEPTTAERGVLGAVPGVLGSLLALEVISWLVGLAPPGDAGRLHALDGERLRLTTTRLAPRPGCPCGAAKE
jgi:molybdopterin/thiamine biosynthesis adenylyltransferase